MLDKKAIFWNTIWQVIVRFAMLAFTLVSIKLLANYLGTDGLGRYNTITTYINFFIVIADLGLFSVTIREIAKNPDQEKKIVSNVFVIRLISALIASTVAILLVLFTNYDLSIKIGTTIAAGFLFFNLLGSVYDIVLQYRLKMQYSALAEFLSKLLSVIALYLIIINRGNFYLIMATVALYGVCIFIFKWFFASKFIKITPAYEKKVGGWIFNLAWPIGIVFIMNNLYFKLDTLMLFILKGAVPVGIYTVAYKILEVIAFIAAYFTSALKPAISAHIEKEKTVVANIINKAFIVLFFVSVPVTVVSIAFSKEIIIFLSNEAFVSGTTALVILSFVMPVLFIDILLAEILIANDERRKMIGISLFIVIFNLAANLYFIPKYSFVGAAFTTLLSEIVLFFVNFHFTRKIVPFRIDWGKIIQIALIGGGTYLFCLVVKNLEINFIFLIGLAILFYFALALSFGVVTKESLRFAGGKTEEI